jgi:pimeloyl-ACP methyl ester carboxylesterase
LKHLGIASADILGYSMGGGVALQTAIRHPGIVGKLVVVSSPIKRSAYYPEILEAQKQVGPAIAEQMKQSPMYETYSRIAPRKEDWSVLLGKLGELMAHDFDWSKEVAALKAPTLIIAADADLFRTSHAVETFELLGGGQKDPGWDGTGRPAAQLAILPGLTHYNIFMSPALAAIAIPFLKAASRK